ncbi:MAG: hypothetical protein OES46_19865, partial [Gammaproteobacteria bacterium]|nr:hypothetical protein [Gammaproteobacteria bacterium]
MAKNFLFGTCWGPELSPHGERSGALPWFNSAMNAVKIGTRGADGLTGPCAYTDLEIQGDVDLEGALDRAANANRHVILAHVLASDDGGYHRGGTFGTGANFGRLVQEIERRWPSLLLAVQIANEPQVRHLFTSHSYANEVSRAADHVPAGLPIVIGMVSVRNDRSIDADFAVPAYQALIAKRRE